MKMSFLPLYRDKKHKFKNGYWKWNEKVSKLKFYSHGSEPHDDMMAVKGRKTENCKAVPVASKVAHDKKKKNENAFKSNDVGLRFVNDIDETDEEVFLKYFQRPKGFYDSDVITIQDIKNLALFTLETKILRDFIDFLYTNIFDQFLHAVIFYIDQFLLTIKFLLIRRDDLNEGMKIRDNYSMEIERFLSKELMDRRLLIAREYSRILLKSGNDSESNRKRTKPSVEKDLIFFESLIDFTIQCAFIVMHRRCYNTIYCEVNRLFRTEFFNIAKYSSRCEFELNFREQQILYGKKWLENSLKNYRLQHSPLIAEILKMSSESEEAEILKIGQEKYFGSNKYLLDLERDFTIPECHLQLIGKRCGILGHPKCFYDTTLKLSGAAVKRMNYSEDYDPYGLIRPCSIDLHTSTDFINPKRRMSMSTRLIIHREPYDGIKDQLKLWKRKEYIMRRNRRETSME